MGTLLPFSLATIAFAGRLYARAVVLHRIRIDDYLLGLGWLAALADCVIAVLATKYGSGIHQENVPLAFFPMNYKLAFAGYFTYALSLGFTKLAIGVFDLQVFGTNRCACRELYALIAFVSCYTLALNLQFAFSCVPVHKSWLPDAAGHCYSQLPGLWIQFSCNVASDIWLIAFAAPRIWYVRLPTRQRMVLVITMTLGWLVVLAAIVRVVRMNSVMKAVDRTWASRDPLIWTSVELNVAIICAAIPALQPILTRFAPGTTVSDPLMSIPRRSQRVPCGTGSNGEARLWNSNGQTDEVTFRLEPTKHEATM